MMNEAVEISKKRSKAARKKYENTEEHDMHLQCYTDTDTNR